MDLARGDRAAVSVLCLNAGSSSLKLALHAPRGAGAVLTGAVEEIGARDARVWLRGADGADLLDVHRPVRDHDLAAAIALDALAGLGLPAAAAVGHRIVHGGRRFAEPAVIAPSVLAELRRLAPLAPLHLPPQIATVEAIAARAPATPQVACFDTAFHRRMPEIAQRLPLPEWAWDEGICRYGFHGLSYEHVVDVLGPGSGRVVIAHLGAGASMAAVHDGAPIDTTMAFTPTAGLMMGTRSGDLDPGLVVHLLRDRGMGVADVERLVTHESGLLGVSGLTADMRALLAARAGDPRAARAVAMFCRSARKAIGALAAALGGIDQLVFTGGIGERAPAVREEICAGLEHLGVRLDPRRNAAGIGEVGDPGARCTVRVVPADEELVIARHAEALVPAARAAPGEDPIPA